MPIDYEDTMSCLEQAIWEILETRDDLFFYFEEKDAEHVED